MISTSRIPNGKEGMVSRDGRALSPMDIPVLLCFVCFCEPRETTKNSVRKGMAEKHFHLSIFPYRRPGWCSGGAC